MSQTGADGAELIAADAPTPALVNAWVSRHRAFLNFLVQRVGNRALAEDILQEAFVRGLDNASALRDDDSAVAWFYRTLRNAVVDHHRRRGSSDRALAALATELEAQSGSDTETSRTVCQCVGELAATLKSEYADALRRVEIEGVPVQQFAAELGISSNNAGVRVFRARNALRRQVARACGTCAEHGCIDCTCTRR